MKLQPFVFVAALLLSIATNANQDVNPDSVDTLEHTIVTLDRDVFDAFNHCDQPGQLEKHASYFDARVEFYHDNGGVTWNRAKMISNTRKYACGNFTRELIPGSIRVYPIKDFGAIELGSHKFCQIASGKCEGLAEFTIIWRHTGNVWNITRVLSYGHRAAASEP